MKGKEFKQLSKTIAHALRHEPGLYGLTLDEEGWTPIDDLMHALRRYPQWRRLDIQDIEEMNNTSPKQRFEIVGDKIRALYGHSFQGRVNKEPSTPPIYLYHGTSPESAREIMREGLHMMNRQYVHLSAHRKGAYMVGKRKAYNPIILVIEAQKADKDGINFYYANEDIWLSDSVPPQFIRYDSH